MSTATIHIVWFKRDLRVQDHIALYEATRHGDVLPIFAWDPSVWDSPDYSTQHLMFVQECLESLKNALQAIGLDLMQSSKGILHVLNQLKQNFNIAGLYSHEETGNQRTYELDKQVAHWCRQHAICWHEYPQNGVVRRLKNRDHWHAIWQKRMTMPMVPVPQVRMAELPEHFVQAFDMFHAEDIRHVPHLQKSQPDKPLRQKGGRQQALRMLNTFLNGRASRYRGGISSPISSIEAGSRISPYLAWGVLSMREVMQALWQQQVRVRQTPDQFPNKLLQGLQGFEKRLHWHCHFMQKLESEPEIEYRNLHNALNGMRDENYLGEELAERLKRWMEGKTGWPLVDACMAMLRETGCINFRMRAMLMSTASYLYWLHWRQTGLHLAREFLDYEPGIHWPQVQMQSGTTGINTLRIYHPIKQARDQDPQGDFVRRWIPALSQVPTTWIFEPWRMTPALQAQYGCIIGKDYPAPMIDVELAMRHARAKLKETRAQVQNSDETRRIVERHASRKARSSAKKTVKPVSAQMQAIQRRLF